MKGFRGVKAGNMAIGNGDDTRNLGKELQRCNLGDDCPFEGALARLEQEQHERIKMESQLAISIDTVSDKAQKASLQLEKFERQLRDFTHEFELHLKKHRYFDLAVITIGATIGGFLAKLVVH